MLQHQPQVPITPATLAATFFCLLAIGMLFFWNLPVSTLQMAINRRTAYVMKPLGLWQSWGMFHAVSPSTYAARLTEVYADGTVRHREMLPQRTGYNQAPDLEMMHNLLGDQSGSYINPMLRYYCKQDGQSAQLMRVDLEVASLGIPALHGPANQPDPFISAPIYQVFKSMPCQYFNQ
jgi:hypothetical protein